MSKSSSKTASSKTTQSNKGGSKPLAFCQGAKITYHSDSYDSTSSSDSDSYDSNGYRWKCGKIPYTDFLL